MKTLILAAAALLLAAPALARDDKGGPPVFGSLSGITPTLRDNPAAGVIYYGGQAIRFEDTELEKLATRLETTVRHRGDGATELKWICFTNEADQTRVWFTGDDLSDGAVDGATLVYLPNVKSNDDCPEAPGNGKVSLPNGVALGLTEADLKAKVGAPSYSHEGLFGYFYGKHIPVGDNSGYRASELWAAVNNGKVGALGLHQATRG